MLNGESSDGVEIRSYFLQWLKLHLDDYSREVLPELHRKCEITRKSLTEIENDTKKLQAKQKKIEIEKLQKRLFDESFDLTNASFGLEHFFRELGQTYEILRHSKCKANKFWLQVTRFPRIAADLLLSGHPLELIDGDAAHIPIEWVMAVLGELKNIIGEQSKLFILSVLGIQSSGKSTLLNAAFGLHFSVSAGRCTRGAYFQLLKCDQTAFKNVCDYVLVIDTEGLRAPELAHKGTQKHDNELAALVIGLAGTTIINVFGEVSGEMDDILQTTVHAFLRMKRAELKPSCRLVKHHIDQVTANKGMEGLRKLQEKLDEMTKYAAKEEHCEGKFEKFADVIQFDVVQDVQYFPNLWIGSPPMAPFDPKYCEEAQKLKMKFITEILSSHAKKHSSVTSSDIVCTLGEFQLRLQKLWTAILRENFIFNFKNTLEIAAFNELDQKSSVWSWDLDSIREKWEHESKKLLKAGKLDTKAEIDSQVKKIKTKLTEKHANIKKEIENLFEKHESAMMLAQWRGSTDIKFLKLVNEIEVNAKIFCNNIVKHDKSNKKVKNKEHFKGKLRDEVKQLVPKMKITKDTTITRELTAKWEKTFSQKWKEWMEEISKDCPPLDDKNIEEEVELQLRTGCGIEHMSITISQRLEQARSLSELATKESLKMPIDKKVHLNCNVGWKNAIINTLWGNAEEMHRYVISGTKDILQKQKQFLDCICEQQDSYNVKLIQQLVRSTQQCIEGLQEEVKATFTFTAEYHADVIIRVCGYALRVFKILQTKSNENHPITYFKTCEKI